jgi:ankyrin repeat protein
MDEFIDLYNDDDHDPMLKFIPRDKFFRLFIHAINIHNMDLIARMLFWNSDYFFDECLDTLMTEPHYDILEIILEKNLDQCINILDNSEIYLSNVEELPNKNNIRLLNIILKYLPLDRIILPLINHTIHANNTHILDILFNAGFNIKAEFDKYISNSSLFDYFSLKKETYLHLQNYNIDLDQYINRLAELYFDTDDVSGLEFCLDFGADVDHVIKKINYLSSVDVIKSLVNRGGNINLMDPEAIKYISDEDFGMDIIIYLVDNGLDISEYVTDLILAAVDMNRPIMLSYYIKMGVDIHFQNDLLLFYSAYRGYIECVEILLENGADVHADNDSILLFSVRINIPVEMFEDDEDRNHDEIKNHFKIANILIKAGAISNNYAAVFCSLVLNLICIPFDKELFTYLLDQNINLSEKIDSDIQSLPLTEYIFELVVAVGSIELLNMCLEYGVDLYINNYSPLKTAIRYNKLESVKILLKLGCRLDENFECRTIGDIIDEVDRYGIIHNLIKSD